MSERIFTVERHVPYEFGEVHGAFTTYEKAEDYLRRVENSAHDGYVICDYLLDDLEYK